MIKKAMIIFHLQENHKIGNDHFNIYIIHQTSKFGNGTPSNCGKKSPTINKKNKEIKIELPLSNYCLYELLSTCQLNKIDIAINLI